MYVLYVCITADCAIQLYTCVCNLQRLRNTILCLRMYVSCLRNYCAIQWPKCAPGDNYDPGLLPGLCGPYLMEECNHKCFMSLPRSLSIAYDFRDAFKIHLNVC